MNDRQFRQAIRGLTLEELERLEWMLTVSLVVSHPASQQHRAASLEHCITATEEC